MRIIANWEIFTQMHFLIILLPVLVQIAPIARNLLICWLLISFEKQNQSGSMPISKINPILIWLNLVRNLLKSLVQKWPLKLSWEFHRAIKRGWPLSKYHRCIVGCMNRGMAFWAKQMPAEHSQKKIMIIVECVHTLFLPSWSLLVKDRDPFLSKLLSEWFWGFLIRTYVWGQAIIARRKVFLCCYYRLRKTPFEWRDVQNPLNSTRWVNTKLPGNSVTKVLPWFLNSYQLTS